MRVSAAGTTKMGTERTVNDDAMLMDDGLGVYMVADGIGGRAFGDLASRTAVQTAFEFLRTNESTLKEIRSGKRSAQEGVKLAEEAVNKACQAVYTLGSSEEKYTGMGSSLTLMVVFENEAVMVHVGNTRLYLWRDGQAHQLSTDHTMANDFAVAGIITEEEVPNHPYEYILTRVLGREELLHADTLLFDFYPGDGFVLCSNGMGESIQNSAAFTTVLLGVPNATAKDIVDEAFPSKDDITVIVGQAGNASVIPPFSNKPSWAPPTDPFRDYLAALGRVPLFDSLTLVQLQRVKNICEAIELSDQDVLLAEGVDCPGLYIVVKGTVALQRNGKTVAGLTQGGTVGELALVPSKRMSRNALVAAGAAQVLLVPREGLHVLMKRQANLGLLLMAKIATRAYDTVDILTNQQDGGESTGSTDLI